MEGVSLDLAKKAMKSAMDWAAFNRLGQYSFGEAIEVWARGMKEQRSQVTDAIGWVTNLDNAWKKYAASIGKTVGQLTNAEKNQGGLLLMIKEGLAVQGDAERAANLYGGALSKMNVVLQNVRKNMGDALLPILSNFIEKIVQAAKKAEEYFYINKELIQLKVENTVDKIKSAYDALRTTIAPLNNDLRTSYDVFSS